MAERGQQVETSGFQPAAPEPSEQPGAFSPAPLPTETPAASDAGGWTYSYGLEQAPAAPAARPAPAPAAEPVAEAPATSYDYGPSRSRRWRRPPPTCQSRRRGPTVR
jgi:hypothetical protein